MLDLTTAAETGGPGDALEPRRQTITKQAARRAIGAVRAEARKASDKVEIAVRDGVKDVKDRAAMAASVGNAEVEKLRSFIGDHVQRRPIRSASVLVGAGLLVGVVLAACLRSSGSDNEGPWRPS